MQSSLGALDAVKDSAAPAEADYRRLFTLSLDLLCIAGLDGYLKHVNPSWTRVLGWSEEELLSRPVLDIMHPEDRVRTLAARAQLAEGTPVCGLENRYLCKDGSYRWLAWQSVTEPEAKQVFAVARDITERRQLDHEQLVMSKLESTGILAGGMAHDFNNLLTGVLLNLGMIGLSGPTTEQQRAYLKQAHETVDIAKSLTDQLITIASGGATRRKPTDLKELLRQSLEIGLRGSSLRGECILASDLWPVEVDEAQIGQAIRNLVLNAREATPAVGHVRLRAENVVLEMSLGPGTPAGAYVRITLIDEGVGIAPDIRDKIFDPYFSTKQRGVQKGMGLGLTISRTVIQNHGGKITINSTPGHGTVVTCYLPAPTASQGQSYSI